ncbi:MobA/MobL family protein, partial [Acinetobacter bereziniae]
DFSRDNGTETVKAWRETFADLVNVQLKAIGSKERVSHLSYEELGNGLEATVHEGYAVTQLRRLGIDTEISLENDAIKQRNAEKTVNEQAITGLDQEIIASESILSDLQRSKAKSDAEHAQQQQIALERKRERLEAQSLADAHKRATDFHTAFDPNHPDKSLVTQYITDYALLARHGKQPQPPAPVEQPQPTWWQRMTGQQPQQIEQPPFFEIEVVKATAQAIVEHEKKQAQQQKWQRLQEFLQYSPSTVDRLERDAISRSFDKGQQAGDEELAEFIKYHRQHWREKEQAAKDWQAERDRFMREEAAKAREEAALTLQRERESEAKLEAYRERKALLDKEIAEMQQKPVNRDEIQQQPRPKNDFEP